MKKISALLLAVLMAMTIFAGCGSEKKEETTADTGSDWEYISEKGKLVVGMTLFAPMNYKDDNGELIGFDTELAQAVGEKLGVEVEFVEINWSTKEVELNAKNLDCIWNGLTIDEDRKENMGITEPYLNNQQVMVMKADREEEIMKDVSGLYVAVEQGSTAEGQITGTIPDNETTEVSAKEYFADSNLNSVTDMATALLEVKAGTSDIAVVDSVCALAMTGEGTDYEDLTVNMDNQFGRESYGIAFRKGSDMVEKVNAVIDELYEDGTVAALADKYGLTELLVK